MFFHYFSFSDRRLRRVQELPGRRREKESEEESFHEWKQVENFSLPASNDRNLWDENYEIFSFCIIKKITFFFWKRERELKRNENNNHNGKVVAFNIAKEEGEQVAVDVSEKADTDGVNW